MAELGDDTFADATIANFARNGIDTTHVIRTPGLPSGVAPMRASRSISVPSA